MHYNEYLFATYTSCYFSLTMLIIVRVKVLALRTRGQHNTGIYDIWACQNKMAEFQMFLPRLDQPIRPPPVEPSLPLSAAEEAKPEMS